MNVKPKLGPTDKRHMVDIYHFSPLVWAVIKGADTPDLIADMLGKPVAKICQGVDEALRMGVIERCQGALMPVRPSHLRLLTLITGNEPRAELNHPVLKVMGSTPMTTADIARLMVRPYNSVYKTLQRMEQRRLVARVGKAWQKL